MPKIIQQPWLFHLQEFDWIEIIFVGMYFLNIMSKNYHIKTGALKHTQGYQKKPNKRFKWMYCIKSFFKSLHLLTFDNKITSIYSMLVT